MTCVSPHTHSCRWIAGFFFVSVYFFGVNPPFAIRLCTSALSRGSWPVTLPLVRFRSPLNDVARVRFMAAMSPSGCLSVVLNSAATPEDMLKAYFLCVVFWEKVCLLLMMMRVPLAVVLVSLCSLLLACRRPWNMKPQTETREKSSSDLSPTLYIEVHQYKFAFVHPYTW